MMWARVVEVMLGLWLVISPFVFGHAEQGALWINDLICGSAIVTLALLSFWHPLRYAHLAIVAIGLWLVFFGFVTPSPALPASQNHILLGLLSAMFGIIPNDANLPPESWRREVNR
jgi:hypothetical protein